MNNVAGYLMDINLTWNDYQRGALNKHSTISNLQSIMNRINSDTDLDWDDSDQLLYTLDLLKEELYTHDS